MSSVNAADALVHIKSVLQTIHNRTVYAIRAAAARGDQPSPKTVEIMARTIEAMEYAESAMLMLMLAEEDSANETAEKELQAAHVELDKIIEAIRERVNPRPRLLHPRMDRP